MSHWLVDLAKKAIQEEFDKKHLIDPVLLYDQHPELSRPQATFVTLHLNGQLRGCIGSLTAYRPLFEDLVHNAKASAFEDPRFYPLSQEEFLRTDVEVSLLSAPEAVPYDTVEALKKLIVPRVDGIILQKGSKKATFLPQVWEQLPSFELFFSHLCQKAGLEANCLEKHPDIWRYRVEKVN